MTTMETPKFTKKNTIEELKKCCRDNGFRGFSKLRKAELIEFVNENLDKIQNTEIVVERPRPVVEPARRWPVVEPQLLYFSSRGWPIIEPENLYEPVEISDEEDTDSLEIMTKVLELCETHMNEGDYLKSANLLMKLINKH